MLQTGMIKVTEKRNLLMMAKYLMKWLNHQEEDGRVLVDLRARALALRVMAEVVAEIEAAYETIGQKQKAEQVIWALMRKLKQQLKEKKEEIQKLDVQMVFDAQTDGWVREKADVAL